MLFKNMRFKKFLILVIITSSIFCGCGNKDVEKFEIEKEETVVEDYDSDIYLTNNRTNKNVNIKDIVTGESYEDSVKYHGTDFSNLKVKHCTTDSEFTLKELINNEQTILILTSATCSACDEMNVNEIVERNLNSNIIFIAFDDMKDYPEKYEGHYLEKLLYFFDLNNISDDEVEQKIFYNLFQSGTTPSVYFINSDNTLSFIINGEKYGSNIEKYSRFLK